MVGIRDIARHMNISVASVSRALNGHPYVNEDLRRSIVQTAQHLGYQPKQSGRSLRTGQSHTVGFMIETHPTNPRHVDNFLMSIVDGVQHIMRQNGLTLLVLPCGSDEDPVEYLRGIVERRLIDGMILTSTRPSDGRVALLKSAALPFVTLGRTTPVETHNWIDLDFEKFAETAVGRLYDRGHRRIAITLPKEQLNFGQITFAAYREALSKRGITFDPALVERITPDEASGFAACSRLFELTDPPTAAVLIHEALAPGFYKSLRCNGVAPGEQFGMVSLKDGRAIDLNPPLTRFKFDARGVGLMLAEILLAEVSGKAMHSEKSFTHKLVPFEIIEGASEGHREAGEFCVTQ